MSAKRKPKKAKRLAKPSTLFALFKDGKAWIKGTLRMDRGVYVSKTGDYWDPDDYEEGEKPPKGYRKIKSEAFCMLGALNHINTKNEDLAIKFLSEAIANDPMNEEQDIAGNNDHYNTTFKDIRRWFKSAIKEAKAAGR